MTEQEFKENAGKLLNSDPELYGAVLSEYSADPYASWDVISARAGASLGRTDGRLAVYSGRSGSPLTEAFRVGSEDMLKIVDPDSPVSWLRMPASELQKAARQGGYVKDLPADATEEERMEQRRNFDRFLKVLSAETDARARRKILAGYENVKFTEAPVEWAKKQVNDILFRTFSKRAKEQALRGEGPTGFGDMGSDDWGTLGLDIMANSLYGAGAGGIAKGVAANGLRTGASLVGSDFAAGVLGGLTDAYNRAANTRAGIRPYEWVTEPVAGGMANALMAPGLLRQGAAGIMGFMGAGKVGNMSRRGALKKSAETISAETGWPEANLASRLDELASAPKYGDAPMTPETAARVREMGEIWNDGLSLAPGEEQTLFDGLQALYESSFKNGKPPSNIEFADRVAGKVSDLEASMANAGASEAKSLKREIDFYRNAETMLDNGILDAEEMLREVGPQRFTPAEPAAAKAGQVFELKGPAYRDEMVMREYAGNAQAGRPVPERTGEIDKLSRKYPEFGSYVDYVEGRSFPRGESTVKYDASFLPPARMSNGEFARNVLGGLEYAAKPAVTVAAMSRYMKEDDSYDAVKAEVDRLMKEKPEATAAALSWAFDPRLPADAQLTPDELKRINRFLDLEMARTLGVEAK